MNSVWMTVCVRVRVWVCTFRQLYIKIVQPFILCEIYSFGNNKWSGLCRVYCLSKIFKFRSTGQTCFHSTHKSPSMCREPLERFCFVQSICSGTHAQISFRSYSIRLVLLYECMYVARCDVYNFCFLFNKSRNAHV